MSESYIPSRDNDALTWMLTFANGIAADPAKYMLVAADAANISALVADFQAAFLVAADPANRTPVNISAKDAARNVAEQLCRNYAMQIKLNVGISDADKIAIGVRPVNTSREPINVPASSPMIGVVGATPGSHTVRYADSGTPDSGAKPFGAAQIQIWVAVADAPTVNEDEAQFYGAFTRNPVGVLFSPEDDGKVATYFARWASRRGDTGPWSLPVSMRIAA